MKKLFVLLIALMLVLSLAACGGDKDPAPSGNGDNQSQSQNNGSDKQGKPNDVFNDITAENCLQLLEDDVGIKISLPDGWSINDASSLVGAHITIDCGGKVSPDEANAFFDSVFAELKKTTGVDGVGHGDDKSYSSFAEGIAAGQYCFHFTKSDGTDIYVDLHVEDYDYSTGEEMVQSIKLYFSLSNK